MKKEEKVTIKIPRPLYVKLGKVIENSSFSSVTDFVVYVLRDVISSNADNSSKKNKEETALSKDEINIIRDRLKNLGYL